MTTDTIAANATKPARTRHSPAAASTPAPVATPAPAAKPTSKSDTVIKLLLRAKGATALELIAATDWRAHSVRAFLSGLRKKGRAIVRNERKSGELAYRIASPVHVLDRATDGAGEAAAAAVVADA